MDDLPPSDSQSRVAERVFRCRGFVDHTARRRRDQRCCRVYEQRHGYQASWRRHRCGAFVALLCTALAPFEYCCSLAAVQRTGDGGFLERCADVSRRWRKRLPACSRGVARCTAAPCCFSKWSLRARDASLWWGVRSAQTTGLRMGKGEKKLQNPNLDRIARRFCEALTC